MIDFLQITNDPGLARRCDLLPGMRLFVDLEIHGKAQRQAGRNTFISSHGIGDVGRVRAQLRRARLMVRLNPLHAGTPGELDSVLAQGADSLMLPMFHAPDELRSFSALVAGRAPIVALLETAGALQTLAAWIDTPGLSEVFVGLNDLHLALGCRFMFEPLAQGLLDRVAACVHARGLRFGFGGIARLDEGLLPGRSVLAEHLRLGSAAVILSRSFHGGADAESFEDRVQALRQAERALRERAAQQVEGDRLRIRADIEAIAARMGQSA
ncbi:aldolase/citrate lyase family protein [Verminephrobacter aporrectodeae]|uniref:aldolase/citrate lyase family protein n=1 Tax=Verminephrobacter aporrectodeae TaxID=1110389 RepID=UPI0022438555|nr:aldolase/citrate lyase family protein [Verminephrobacter aporrectodeae]MCW8175965.1 aldolase [Verminephrobacter aporrectodeae subsp. tuberculatae]MCW8197040.1 aldolase [Verminephrobacter aporrectodeae subsp. tuberculatae]MCW8201510.1 aldolase [Verminephrobacter aporrectodeae subsp. tuberculatae]MCW8205705.1 aldolase [Verminephrobacter aporrectodeae subsp. tuberculatae]